MIFTRENRHTWRCHSDHPKSLVDWSGFEPWPPCWDSVD